MPTLDLMPVEEAPALDLQPSPEPSPTAPKAVSAPPNAPKTGDVAPEGEKTPAPDWLGLFSGLDGLDARLSPNQRAWFNALDGASENPKEARARALNQAYLSTQLKGFPAMGPLTGNWPAFKSSYAKLVYGIDEKDLTDQKLYAAIGQRLQADADSEQFGEFKPWTWQDATAADVRRMKQSASRFWESINHPIVKLPDPPEDLPDLPQLGEKNPAVVAGVYKGLKPLIEGVESPFGVATLGTGALLQSAGKAYPAAKAALMGMTGIFTGLMAKSAVEGGERVPAILSDPNASTQEKVAAMTETVGSAGMAALGALGLAFEALPKAEVAELTAKMEGKGPLNAAAILEEAAKNKSPLELPPEEAKAVRAAAKELRDIGEHTDVLEDTPDSGAPTMEESEPIDTSGLEGKTTEGLPVTKRVASQGDPVGIKNESVNAELRAMGLPELTEAEQVSQKAQAEAAAKTLKEDEFAGAALVDRLKQSKRPPTSDEVALLTAEMNRRRLIRDAAEQELVDAVKNGDADSEAGAKFKIAAARDAFAEIADLTKDLGTEQGRAFAARQMMMREDYSLAAVERRRQAARGGKALNPEEVEQIRDLTTKLAQTEKAFADYRVEQTAAAAEGRTPVAPPRQPPRPNAVRQYLADQAEAARARIQSRFSMSAAEEGGKALPIDPAAIADYAIIGAEYLARGVTKFADWSAAMVKEFGDSVKPHLQDIFDRATENRNDAVRLGAFKTRTARATEKLQTKLESGDIAKEPARKPVPLDEEALRLKTEYERVKRAIDLAQHAAELEEAPMSEKVRTAFQGWVRFGALSYPSVVAKLTTAAIGRFLVTPAEQLVGVGFGKILPEAVTSKAQFENVPSLGTFMRSEVKAIVRGMTDGIRGSADLLANRETELTTLMKGEQYPSGVLEYMGKIHAALKNPAKEADFARRLQLVTEAEAARGVDVTHPVEQMRLMHAAYEYSQRSIFMQDNGLVNAYKAAIRSLEANQKAQGGKPSPALQLLSTGIQANLPIVKVPTNVAVEISEYVSGALQGPARLVWQYAKGIDGLTNAEADMILRQLKKGTIGAAVLLLGYYQADKIGGFYQRGEKRKPDEVPAMAVQVGDKNIPKQLADSPLFDVLQYGATVRRVGDSLIKKAGGEPKGPLVGLFAATMGLTEEVPFVRETVGLDKLMEAEGFKNAAEQKAASILIPGAVQWIAAQMDKETPFSQFQPSRRRKPASFEDALKKGIPGLREDVPQPKKR